MLITCYFYNIVSQWNEFVLFLWQIMEVTQAPIIASHSNSRSVCPASRNLTDEMFRAICATGGVAGFNLCADFVGEEPTVDTACDHIFHFLEFWTSCHL